jgi:DnaJ family protein C protein 3
VGEPERERERERPPRRVEEGGSATAPELETEIMLRAWGRTALPPLLILGLLRLHFSPLVVAQGAPPFPVHAIILVPSS